MDMAVASVYLVKWTQYKFFFKVNGPGTSGRTSQGYKYGNGLD